MSDESVPSEITKSRTPRDRGVETSRGGANRIEPTPERFPENPEPRPTDYRDHPLPSAPLPAVDR